MHLRLYLKVSLLLAGVLTACLATFITMGYFKYQKALNDLVNDRAIVAVRSLQSTIENNLALGLPLVALTDAEVLLHRTKQQDAAILSVSLFTPRGNVLFATDAAEQGQPVPETWLQAVGHLDKPTWTMADGGNFVLGAVIRNSFNAIEAVVALRYSGDYVRRRARHMLRETILASLPVLGGVLLLGVAGCFAIFRPLGRKLGLAAATVGGTAGGPPAGPGGQASGMASDFVPFAMGLGEALAEVETLNQITQQALAMDLGTAEEDTPR